MGLREQEQLKVVLALLRQEIYDAEESGFNWRLSTVSWGVNRSFSTIKIVY